MNSVLKQMHLVCCMMAIVIFFSRLGHAEDPQEYLNWYNQHNEKYFQYMYDQTVSITPTLVEIRFRWKKEKVFQVGDEFELGVMIDPKQFAQPVEGNDYQTNHINVVTNMPCGVADAFNYSNPNRQITDQVYNLILQECSGLTEKQKKAVRKIANIYPDAADKAANFTGLSTCPEMFIADNAYFIRYFLKPVNGVDNSEISPECSNNERQPGWGYFWINSKVQNDTLKVFVPGEGPPLYPNYPPSTTFDWISVADCPYLIGLPWNPLTAGIYTANASAPVILFNRGCAPTDKIAWGMPDPLGAGWKGTGGVKCHDCDHDGLYDTDFKTPVYGSKAKDCNDQCADVNVCDQSYTCGGAVCSEQCGGDGCEGFDACFRQPTYCNGECRPGNLKTRACGWLPATYAQEQICLDDCTWGPWNDCNLLVSQHGFSNCNPGNKLYKLCSNQTDASEWTCTNQGVWEKDKDCPINFSVASLGPIVNIVVCEAGSCTPDDIKYEACGVNGNQEFTCDDTCTWQVAGGCVEGCNCSSGMCCDGCSFKTTTTVCDQSYEYSCQGSNLGDDAIRRLQSTYCSGVSSDCNGLSSYESWETYQSCASNQLCQNSNGVSSCVQQSCSNTYSVSVSQACLTNSGSGNPTICLYIEQLSGADWKWHICKQGGAFQNSFSYQLYDESEGNLLGSLQSSQGGVTCTSPITQNFNYLSVGSSAGLRVNVKSPSDCTQNDCKYQTGTITLQKSCNLDLVVNKY